MQLPIKLHRSGIPADDGIRAPALQEFARHIRDAGASLLLQAFRRPAFDRSAARFAHKDLSGLASARSRPRPTVGPESDAVHENRTEAFLRARTLRLRG